MNVRVLDRSVVVDGKSIFAAVYIKPGRHKAVAGDCRGRVFVASKLSILNNKPTARVVRRKRMDTKGKATGDLGFADGNIGGFNKDATLYIFAVYNRTWCGYVQVARDNS